MKKITLFQRFLRLCLLGLTYLLCSVLVSYVFFTYPGINKADVHDISFESIISQHTRKPMITRALVPFILRAVPSVLPTSVEQYLQNSPAIRTTLMDLGATSDNFVEYFLFIVFVFICYLSFLFAFRAILQTLALPSALVDFAPPIALLNVVTMFDTLNVLYDPATLFLFTMIPLLLLRQKIWLFYLFFVISCINKETTVLLIIPAILMQWKVKNGRALFWEGIALFCIWIVIYGSLAWTYRDYPGHQVELHWRQNLGSFIYVSPNFLQHFIPYLIIIGFMASGWAEKPKSIRYSFLGMALIILPIWFICGRIQEFRDIYELYPFALMLAVPTVASFYGARNKDEPIIGEPEGSPILKD